MNKNFRLKLAASVKHGQPLDATQSELAKLQSTLDNPCALFLGHCKARRDAATTQAGREFWHRMAGTVRKAKSMD